MPPTAVVVHRAPLVLPTYLPAEPEKNPMFLDKRVYQGSSGRVYPLPFTDRIAENRTDVAWDAVHIENEFLRLTILPQIGGRIHVGHDKTNGYDFFYRQDVIKPALVGLAGPWISGGVEFNWPQHHRPSTFLPADVEIEEHSDGSRTVWLSEHEPMNRLKGMHGVCLHPGRSVIELKARVYNRTETTQTFLWWANVATRVHGSYQSFFPPDVHYVADHAKRSMSEFPACADRYYGVAYGERARSGVPEGEKPAQFAPDAECPANDLSWYANIPVPTSYMAMGTDRDFFGGYDHAAQAGVVHVANHHIAPGKKQWTWGNHEFGYAWDRNLTDPDARGACAPYIELMAGVYTDNQPDFSFLGPGETRTWSQFWYPIQKIGVPREANIRAAASVQKEGKRMRIGVAASEAMPDAHIILTARDGRTTLAQWRRNLSPAEPFLEFTKAPARGADGVRLRVFHEGAEVLQCRLAESPPGDAPPPATEPALPPDIPSTEELYITGLHLHQYRHATRRAEDYWREALRRDAGDARCNNAMGLWHMHRGEFEQAEAHFRRAVARLTLRNPNPADGEPHYHLGLALRHLERDPEAYDALYKATWNAAWQSPAFFALAELDCRRGEWARALEHLDRSLRTNIDHLKAHNLRVLVLRNLGRHKEAQACLDDVLALDPLDWCARHLCGKDSARDPQTQLDVALDLARAGFHDEAIAALRCSPCMDARGLGSAPMIRYTIGWLHQQAGRPETAAVHFAAAAETTPDYCFPARLEEIAILRAAIAANPRDARAAYYLGNLLYDRGRREEAITLWETSTRLDDSFPTAWRNLGIAYHNVRHQTAKARAAYEHAFRKNPKDARVLYERDQLWKRLGERPARRLRQLEKHAALVRQRDDLSVELAALYNQTGRPLEALAVLSSRTFQPWEGGEGQALGQHTRTHLALGRQALGNGNAQLARAHFETALTSPRNLGEARHLLANPSDALYELGLACEALGDGTAARRAWTAAANTRGDFQEMSVKTFSEMTLHTALALEKLGRKTEARKLLRALLAHAKALARTPAKIDYFATSLPNMLVFDDDIDSRQRTTALFLQAQAQFGLGQRRRAATLLEQVLARDPNHAMAADLQASLARK